MVFSHISFVSLGIFIPVLPEPKTFDHRLDVAYDHDKIISVQTDKLVYSSRVWHNVREIDRWNIRMGMS